MSLQVAPRTLALILAGVIALIGVGGWVGLVGSQRSSASSLDEQTADAQVNLDALKTPAKPTTHKATSSKAKAQARAAKTKAAAKASEAAQLQAAFPTAVGMPSILLQVQKLATQSKVSLESFAPAMPTPVSGYDSIAIDVTVTGHYRAIQRFVHALRVQAASVHGRVHASGRLFSVETVGITPAADGPPVLSATILLDAFVYSGVVPATDPAATDPTATDGSTQPATTTTTTTSEGTS
jgi:Tfp pilus assembly protein PilO